MIKLFQFIIIILLFQQLAMSQADEKRNSRLILFKKAGQIEHIKSGESVSIVYGPDIKPEYTFLAYSMGKNPGEYLIELKTTELYLKEISKLRNSVDSLKLENTHSESNKEQQSNFEDKRNTADSVHREKSLAKMLKTVDSLQNYIDLVKDDFPVIKIPKVVKYLNTLKGMVDNNKNTVHKNSVEYNHNKLKIDSLLQAIDYARKTGIHRERIDEYMKEIDSLKARNQQILIENLNLSNGNILLMNELSAKEREFSLLLNIIYLLIGLTVVIIIAAGAVYWSYRQKKLFNDTLKKVNTKLEYTNNELNHLNLRLNNQNDMLLTLNKEKGALLATINKELNLASKYVLSLIPIPIKEGKVTSDWIFVPSRDLGGDAFGYNYLGKSQFAFYLLDVSGHGIGPALHSLQVLNILQNRTLPKVDFSKPDEVMTALNKIFQMENYRDMFFTMVYCVYDFSTKKLRYSSAGHPPIIMVSVDGLKLLEAQTIFIGASLKTEFYFNEIELTSPTSFYIFSDGVFELSQLDGKMYTFLEFKDLIYNEIELSGRKLDTLYKFALNMVGQEYLEDDYSILKIKIE